MTPPKDLRLAQLADHHNVAQFVSFSASHQPELRFSRIRGYGHDFPFPSVRDAIDTLMANSWSKSVNIRTFLPQNEKGNPFIYGLTSVDEATSRVLSLADQGYITIVNETIDTDDGGVSGVTAGGIVEFTPFDTPRGVEKPGIASLPYEAGLSLLATVYGFQPDLAPGADERLEFSLHPMRVGYRRSHTLLWETGNVRRESLHATIYWPNRFSRLIGDKAYGLLLAHCLGLPVPATTVFPRAIAPFSFGRPTGTGEIWMRTAPAEPRPGHFPTTFGWHDPYALLAAHDPGNSEIASVLAQEGVEPAYSGATLSCAGDAVDYVEGVPGRGDEFMIGRRTPEDLPSHVVAEVRHMLATARQLLGATSAEFVHDGRQPWIVQLHQQRRPHAIGVISSGDPSGGWLDFDPDAGLEVLEDLIQKAHKLQKGIRVTAPVGLTSHVGDLLRRSGRPARLEVLASA